MPIINGKKRYIVENTEKPPVEKKRYEPPAAPAPAPVKRYVRGQGPSVTKVLNREATREFIGSFEFDVRINLIQVNFSKITGIENKIETETFVEGGNNDFPIVRQKARQKPDIIIFEKGMTSTMGGTIFSILRQGMKLTNILIFVKRNGKLMKIFSIDEGLILSKKFGDLDSNSSAILIESLELAHTGFSEIPIP
ncbi:phage tail protein [Bacilliculturomica massiliensis]|uniref:phage tail protein n=1 Tax=Bacilliculturomica massiliensis TaxID=1917867 RepID=UPI0010319EB0|nr:phage tail protein [Bacilliculturomica massiliensis]